jgi:ABC-type antimicrobial peptide transport system permease subunit
VESRAAVERRLQEDPLSRGSLLTVAAAAVGAGLLALVGLLLLVAADARDERRELRDLEAEGMAPRALRRHVRLRAGLVAALGLAGGLVLAAVLAPLVVDLVSVAATARTPEPPLVVRIGWPLLVGGLAAASALASVLVLAATRRTPS